MDCAGESDRTTYDHRVDGLPAGNLGAEARNEVNPRSDPPPPTGQTQSNAVPQPPASPMLDTLFKRNLARQPDALALVDPPNKQRITGQPPKRLTFAQADRMISSLAAHFIESGLPANSVIAV